MPNGVRSILLQYVHDYMIFCAMKLPITLALVPSLLDLVVMEFWV